MTDQQTAGERKLFGYGATGEEWIRSKCQRACFKSPACAPGDPQCPTCEVAEEYARMEKRITELEQELAREREKHDEEAYELMSAAVESLSAQLREKDEEIQRLCSKVQTHLAEEIDRSSQWEATATSLLERAETAERQLRDMASSGVELDDARLDYVTIQVDRATWEAIRPAPEQANG